MTLWIDRAALWATPGPMWRTAVFPGRTAGTRWRTGPTLGTPPPAPTSGFAASSTIHKAYYYRCQN